MKDIHAEEGKLRGAVETEIQDSRFKIKVSIVRVILKLIGVANN
jgi:hypothetical protein